MDTKTVYFSARLSPNASLSRRDFHIVMALFGVASLGTGVLFLMQGAWPVFGFFGLDVALFYVAFRLNYTQARRYEVVELVDDLLKVTEVSARKIKREWTFNAYWVRVKLSRTKDEIGALHLTSHGRRVEVGSFLSPHEREEFSNALESALGRLKQTRH
ncbi:MAG: DUF2244 domain-containing protein [Parvibaculales bacterium]